MTSRAARHCLPLLALALLLSLGLSVAPQATAQEPQPQPEAAQTPVGKALERVSAGDLAGAVAILEPIANDPSTSPLAKALLGGLLVEVNRPADALKVLAPLADAENADPAVLFNAGRAALGAGRQSQGETYLQRSAAREPGSIASRELGLLRYQQGRWVESFQLLRPWVERNPRDREAMLAAADSAVELRRVPEANQILSLAAGEDNESALIRGKLLVLQGDLDGAQKLVEPRLANAPAEMEARMIRLLADLHLRNGNSAAAVELLTGKTGNDPLLRLFLARAHYMQGQIDESAQLYETLAPALLETRSPTLPAGLVALGCLEYGRVLLAGNQADKALPFLKRTTEMIPNERQGWQALGQAYLMAGQQAEGEAAMAKFQEVSAQGGEDPYRQVPPELANADPTQRNMVEAMRLLEAGEVDKGLAAIRQEQELSPNDVRPFLQEVHALLILKRNQAAATAADRVVTRFPDQADPVYLRGVTGMALDRMEQAEQDLRKAISLSPEHTAAMNDLAVLLMVQKRHSEAKQLLERVLELRPDDANATTNLARLAEASG